MHHELTHILLLSSQRVDSNLTTLHTKPDHTTKIFGCVLKNSQNFSLMLPINDCDIYDFPHVDCCFDNYLKPSIMEANQSTLQITFTMKNAPCSAIPYFGFWHLCQSLRLCHPWSPWYHRCQWLLYQWCPHQISWEVLSSYYILLSCNWSRKSNVVLNMKKSATISLVDSFEIEVDASKVSDHIYQTPLSNTEVEVLVFDSFPWFHIDKYGSDTHRNFIIETNESIWDF